MKAYASLHTAEPGTQKDSEVSYKGYRRVEIDYADDFGCKPVTVVFPEIQEYSDMVITHACIGFSEDGDGAALRSFHLGVIGQLTVGKAPRVVFANIPEPLPENLNPIARVVWHLVNDRKIDTASLHPKLFEAVNDALYSAGVPVLRVVREGAAKMDIKLHQMPSLSRLN